MTSPRCSARRAILVLVALAVASCTLVGGCTSSAGSPPAASVRAVATLLARHGAAVRERDRAAFVADLAGGARSAAFRGRQQATFNNLAKVPLQAWTYTVGGRTDDRSAERAASARYGRPAIIVRLSLRYALRGVDRQPSDHDLWWTFVQVDGQTRIAGDTDLADAGGRSWRGPWDFGPLVVQRTASTLVLAHPADRSLLAAVSATVESAIPAVTAVWGRTWSRHVAVLVPGSAPELAADAGDNSGVTSDVAALAVSDAGATPSGSVPGQRLLVNPQAFARLSAVGRQIVIRHEVTHLASAAATSDNSPRWLVEGFAEYVGNLGSGQPVTVAASELRADVRRGRIPSTLPGEVAFQTASTAPQAYEQAWLACRLIAARAGQAALVRFYTLVGAPTADPTDPVAAALRAVLHESSARFVAQWRTYLTALLR